MLRQLRDANIERIRQRVSEADCPVTPALSVETLENIVVELADDLARFEPTTRATQPEAALREALANIKGIAEAALNFHDCPDCGAVFDVASAALKDHRHG